MKSLIFLGICFVGFVASEYQIPTDLIQFEDDCGGLVDESRGIVLYNYNKPFPKESCLWTFTSRNESNLGALEFTLLVHGFTNQDYFDSLKFFYVQKNGSIAHAGSLNANRGDPVIVNSRVVFMSFAHYNHGPSDKATGFILQFRGVETTETGGNTAISNTGRFYADFADPSVKSFTYQSNKKQDEYATVVVHNKNVYTDTGANVVRISNVQMLGRCSNDALRLYSIRDNGYRFDWPEIGSVCSTGPTYNITLGPGRSLLAVFTSNDEYQYDANRFKISWD